MRVATRLMMASAMRSADGRSMALLPPIPLYRRLLRAHRKFLPKEMRLLGDEYVKAEFRSHREVDNPVHIATGLYGKSQNQVAVYSQKEQIGFLTEWQLYAQKIEGNSWVGEKLDKGKIEKMSDEQLGQLYELMKAIQNRDSDGDPSS